MKDAMFRFAVAGLLVVAVACGGCATVTPNKITTMVQMPFSKAEVEAYVTSPTGTNMYLHVTRDTSAKLDKLVSQALEAMVKLEKIKASLAQFLAALPPPVAPAPTPPSTPVVTNSTPVESQASTNDAVDLSDAVLLGTHANKGSPLQGRITHLLKGDGRMEGGKLLIDYADPCPDWPLADGIEGVSTRNYFFWEMPNGPPRGGHFEWSTNCREDRGGGLALIFVPEQQVPRGLQNIRTEYLGELPPIGARCYTLAVRNNMTERTQVVFCGVWGG